MRAFELYFNPKKKDGLFLHSFVYAPASIYEKKLGNLYMAGELARALPQNAQFLANLCSTIKKEYYSSGLKKSCAASMREALRKGNEFLEQESKNGNVGWLGNLNFVILSFKEPFLNFAKTGSMKVFLARNDELTDISQALENGSHPDPLKVFSSMAGGKLAADDKIIALNKEIVSSLPKKQNFLAALAKASDESAVKQAMKIQREVLSSVCGVCLVLTVTDEEDEKQTIIMQNKLPNFSFRSAFLKPAVGLFAKIKIPRPKMPHLKIGIPKVAFPAVKRPVLPRLPKIRLAVNRKKLILVLGLILVLAAFYYIFSGERKRELENARQAFNEAQNKAMLAESLLILEKNEQARALFEEALLIISPLTKRGAPFREEALPLQNSIKENLK